MWRDSPPPIRREHPRKGTGFTFIEEGFALLTKGLSWFIGGASYNSLAELGSPFQWGCFTLAYPRIPECEQSSSQLTACVMCRNSVSSLEACLASVRPHVDQLLLCDTGSNDATLDIARRYADHVYTTEWCGSYAEHRNYLLAKVSSQWAFMLDADELVSSFFGVAIRRAISLAEQEGCGIVWLPRLWASSFYSSHRRPCVVNCWKGSWLHWPDPQARLLDLRYAPTYIGALHERAALGRDGGTLLSIDQRISLMHVRLLISTDSERRLFVESCKKRDPQDPHIYQLLPLSNTEGREVSINFSIDRALIEAVHVRRERSKWP